MQPKEVSDVLMAFPAKVVDEYMIPYAEIPKNYPHRQFYEQLQHAWFYTGLKKSVLPVPKPGIDMTQALRHLQAIQGSFEPKHEHKTECVAYLLSLWFGGPETVGKNEWALEEQKPATKKPVSKGRQKRRR